MKSLKKICYVLTARQKFRVFILFIMILVGALLELIGVAAILPVVNVAMTPDAIEQNNVLRLLYSFSGKDNVNDFLIFLCSLLIVVYIFKNMYLLFMRHMQNTFMCNNQFRLSREMTDYYISKPYLYHVNHNRSEIIRNISNDSIMFYQAVSAVIQLITDITICMTLFLYLLISDIQMTLVTVIILVSFMLFFLKVTRKKIDFLGKKYREYAYTMGNKLYQMFGGIKEIKVLERTQYFVDAYYRDYDNNIKYTKKYKFFTLLPSPVAETVIVCGLLGVIIFKMSSGINMQNLIPTLAVFALAAFRMLPCVNRITTQLTTLTYNRSAVDAVYDAIKTARTDNEKKDNVYNTNPRDDFKFENEIRVENLTFSYPERTEKVLDNVSLIIPKNKSVAFIGPSGAGKTTLADIIINLFIPKEGKVTCDGHDINEYSHQWHKMIGYIPQNVFLLDESIRNNIAFGIKEEDIDERRIEIAIEKAQLSDFINTLSEGVYTSIGECGARLSGGQRQRIGIARALYYDPDILIMDEATSALDNDTESAVMEAIERFTGEKTLIIIAHRLSTIANCDLVYEVNNGKVKPKKL